MKTLEDIAGTLPVAALTQALRDASQCELGVAYQEYVSAYAEAEATRPIPKHGLLIEKWACFDEEMSTHAAALAEASSALSALAEARAIYRQRFREIAEAVNAQHEAHGAPLPF